MSYSRGDGDPAEMPNNGRFSLANEAGTKSASKLAVREPSKTYRLCFDDGAAPTPQGGLYTGLLCVGEQVHFCWRVVVVGDDTEARILGGGTTWPKTNTLHTKPDTAEDASPLPVAPVPPPPPQQQERMWLYVMVDKCAALRNIKGMLYDSALSDPFLKVKLIHPDGVRQEEKRTQVNYIVHT